MPSWTLADTISALVLPQAGGHFRYSHAGQITGPSTDPGFGPVPTDYAVDVNNGRRTAAKRAAGSPSSGPAPKGVDQLHAAIRAVSSRFNAAAVTPNLKTLLQKVYRRYRAGLPPDHLMVDHCAAAPHAVPGRELRS